MGLRCQVLVYWKLHTDRERFNYGPMTLTVDRRMLPVDATLQCAIYRLEEIAAMGLNVKTNYVSTQEALKQLALPRADRKSLGVWPGNMPKNGNSCIGALPLD